MVLDGSSSMNVLLIRLADASVADSEVGLDIASNTELEALGIGILEVKGLQLRGALAIHPRDQLRVLNSRHATQDRQTNMKH